MTTEINVAIEMKQGKVSLNHDNCICHGDCLIFESVIILWQ